MEEYITHSRDETVALGRRLAAELAPGSLIAFTGGLPAVSMARMFIRGQFFLSKRAWRQAPGRVMVILRVVSSSRSMLI